MGCPVLPLARVSEVLQVALFDTVAVVMCIFGQWRDAIENAPNSCRPRRLVKANFSQSDLFPDR
jgi:hypothetical protein